MSHLSLQMWEKRLNYPSAQTHKLIHLSSSSSSHVCVLSPSSSRLLLQVIKTSFFFPEQWRDEWAELSEKRLPLNHTFLLFLHLISASRFRDSASLAFAASPACSNMYVTANASKANTHQGASSSSSSSQRTAESGAWGTDSELLLSIKPRLDFLLN